MDYVLFLFLSVFVLSQLILLLMWVHYQIEVANFFPYNLLVFKNLLWQELQFSDYITLHKVVCVCFAFLFVVEELL